MGNSNLFQTLSERFMRLGNIFAINKQISYRHVGTMDKCGAICLVSKFLLLAPQKASEKKCISTVDQSNRMSHWRRRAKEGAEFQNCCKWPAFLSNFSRYTTNSKFSALCYSAASMLHPNMGVPFFIFRLKWS
jgi:hypothetical protein